MIKTEISEEIHATLNKLSDIFSKKIKDGYYYFYDNKRDYYYTKVWHDKDGKIKNRLFLFYLDAMIPEVLVVSYIGNVDYNLYEMVDKLQYKILNSNDFANTLQKILPNENYTFTTFIKKCLDDESIDKIGVDGSVFDFCINHISEAALQKMYKDIKIAAKLSIENNTIYADLPF